MMLEKLSPLTFLQKLTKLQKFNSTNNTTGFKSKLEGCKLQVVDKLEKASLCIEYESKNSEERRK